MTILFWTRDPNVLLDPHSALQWFPVASKMNLEEQLNALTRLVFLMTIFFFFTLRETRLLVIGAITLASIAAFYEYRRHRSRQKQEPFSLAAAAAAAATSGSSGSDASLLFVETTPRNPFGNVMLTDFADNPNRKPAPLLTNTAATNTAKQTVMDNNPGQPGIADKLFRDLGEEYIFEQSLAPFHSMPSTTIPNDAHAFAHYCYGNMPSQKVVATNV